MNNSDTFSVSVVIPALNAEQYLPQLLDAIASQKPTPPNEIILVDSGSSDNTVAVASRHPLVKIVKITDFSHGRSRNLGAKTATGDIIVLLTQDALPKDNSWLNALLAPFADSNVAAAYSRQVPRENAPPTERFFLNHHFPPGESIRREKHGNNPLTLAEVFFSNVSAAIRKETLTRYPFDETLIMSEDQQFARDVVNAGYAIVYEPESVVIHSHKYSLATAFRRYFDSVYSLTIIFSGHDMKTSGAMGARYLRKELCYICKRHPLYLPYYCLYTLAKVSGTIAGHFADKLPVPIARACSLHRYHWK